MVFHELATNAAKHGALWNDAAGLIDIAWQVEPTPRGDRMRLRWQESGGPPVTPLGVALDETPDAGLDEILLPAPDGCFRNSGLAHDRHDAMAIGAHEHNPRALGDLLSSVPVGEQTLKFGAPLALEHDLRLLLPHPASESYSRRRWIQMFVTEH